MFKEKAEEVFDNILQRSLSWGDRSGGGGEGEDADAGPSPAARAFVEALLALDPAARLGSAGGVEAVKGHPFFDGIPWAGLTAMHSNVPFVPSIESAHDTSYFSPDRRKNMTTVEEPPTPVARQVSHGQRFQGFGFSGRDQQRGRRKK